MLLVQHMDGADMVVDPSGGDGRGEVFIWDLGRWKNKYGHARYLYRATSRMPADRYIAMIETQMRMLAGWIFISSDTRLVTSWS